MSRALTTLLLLQAGYSYVPYRSLESVIEENKEAYYLALRRTQTSLRGDAPDWEAWLTFFLQALHTQKSRLETLLEREQTLEGALPEISVTILQAAQERGRIKSGEIVTLSGAARSTVRARLNDLVERGLLVRHGKGPATWYTPHTPA